MSSRRVKHIELALQGGGAHGAFTWGVLDRLLEDERIGIDAISGTSAGAMNAVVLVDGLMTSGRDGAREALRRFWSRVSNAAGQSALLTDAWSTFFGNWPMQGSPLQLYLDWVGRSMSPYQFNPMDLNPLRDIVAAEVDFERVRACDKVRLFVSATNVRTGRLREFRQSDLSADVVMASACLPLVFRAVEIDGEAYWDGGYLGNPSLLPLIAESPAHDLLLVQINPSRRDTLPTMPQDILDRLNEITFNSSLVKELRSLALIQQFLRQEEAPPAHGRAPLFRQIAALRMHRIEDETELAGLGASSKANTGWSFLRRLHRIGYGVTEDWLQRNFTHLGRRSTLDLSHYLNE
ncbi:MAG: patatin-like phospholipase family protein [Gammaproteobacteria bacterium]|uniref:patatin-like phospholipase family protein n=1 Tax=Rhodoferax sp. TaxID=50421 RepID=UPI0017CFB5ED|nr:patatin-like phospholipase family protein [Rhodoferax sp.]MBU3900975.1 patatin-like phospholipase family protein [Gammaproteobacteria bacterium]MBA3058333.1 patatin-like phospholipase family protein [Rhodoferax sp.]MBU3996796.1 patatin-like phospholipase family protein [Gammaproteobacteria bacterium]MBU4017649.1 patatin-like phospholipase family protein [Gammaproteobacteria bacterium]MBU4081092.1 patatin-like phospholipase family protein [Gammaproteobacteria bacterium]